jgi:NarL family two-component system response regulator YdfI
VIRVAIAADSPVVREGLKALVATCAGMELAGAFADLSGIAALRPDVVLASALEPGDGEGPPIVLLAGESDPAFTHERYQAGVRALLPRDAGASQILAAVEAVGQGLAVIEPRELDPLLQTGAAQNTSQESDLTPRELEVLRMMAEGAANKTIAWKLGISEHTAKFHVASILGKLHAGTRTEAVTVGIRRGLVLI